MSIPYTHGCVWVRCGGYGLEWVLRRGCTYGIIQVCSGQCCIFNVAHRSVLTRPELIIGRAEDCEVLFSIRVPTVQRWQTYVR